MTGRNDPCWCGSGQKWKKCHYPAESSALTSSRLVQQYLKQYKIILKTPEQINGIRRASRLTAQILEKTCLKAKAGVTTNELNSYAQQMTLAAGATPASLHYGHPPFPKSICTSINEVICHGIPDNRPLEEGDIVNIDLACILDGYYGDCSKMVMIGEVNKEKKHVVEVAYECLMRSIAILKPGVLVSEIGNVIEDYAVSQGCSVVSDFVAHGVGLAYHEPPQIPHNRNHLQIPLAAGMTFTIEPMINIGRKESVIDPRDHWTARTIDGKPSAQWEHTLLMVENGYEILTLPD